MSRHQRPTDPPQAAVWDMAGRLVSRMRDDAARGRITAGVPSEEVKRRAEAHLIDFVKMVWPSVSPDRFVDGWAIDAICEHLEAVSRGQIKRIVFKGVPDRTTRLAMLKTGEADIGFLMVGLEAATIKADPKLRLAKVIAPVNSVSPM